MIIGERLNWISPGITIRMALLCSLASICLWLSACGGDAASVLKKVQSLETKGDYAGAIEQLAGGLSREPSNGTLRYHLGRIYGLQFDGPTAEHEFRKAIEAGAVEGGRVALGLGRALVEQRKYSEIIADVVASPVFEQSTLASVHALRGHAFMMQDRMGEAKKELEAAIKVDLTNEDVALLQLRAKAVGRDIDGALQQANTLLANNPKNVEGWLHRAALLTIEGKLKEALASYDKAIDTQPRHLHALVGRSLLLIYMGRLRDAENDLNSLSTAYPRHRALAYIRGQIHYWRGEYRQALDMAQAGLRVNEENAPVRLLSGMAYLMLDSPAQAEYEFSRYLAQDPHNMLARRVLMVLRSAIRDKQGEAKQALSGDFDSLRKASVQALFSDSYVREWQYSKAAVWMEQIVTEAPSDLLIAVKIAQRRFSREQLDLAALDLERSAAVNDDITPVDRALVLMQLARGDPTKAHEAVSAMEKKSPQSPHSAAYAGIIWLTQRQPADAERALDEALRRDPKYVAALAARARLDTGNGKVELARKRFDEALRVDPGNLQVLIAYVRFEEDAGRGNELRSLLDRAMQEHPNALATSAVRLALLRREGAKAEATAVAERLIVQHPQELAAMELAADAYIWAGDPARGLKLLKRLAGMRPNAAEAWFRLAKAQYHAGLKEEANQNLERALVLPTDDPETKTMSPAGLKEELAALDGIELARKSYKGQLSMVPKAQIDNGLGRVGTENTLYDALSSTR